MIDVFGGLMGLGSLFGGLGAQRAQRDALRAQTALTRLISGQYGQYMPQMNALLWQMIQNPWSNPMFLAQQRQTESDVNRFYNGALKESAMRAWRQMGGSPDSSIMQGALAGALSQGGNTLAQQRFGQIGQGYGNMMNALQQLSGNVGPMAGQALNSYSNLAGVYGDAASAAYQGLGQLGQAMGTGGYRPQGPPVGSPDWVRQNGGIDESGAYGGSGNYMLTGDPFGMYGTYRRYDPRQPVTFTN